MDAAARKTAPRLIPYGLYVITTKAGDSVSGATVNWVSQMSFDPPLLALGGKKDTKSFANIKAGGRPRDLVPRVGAGRAGVRVLRGHAVRGVGVRGEGPAGGDGAVGFGCAVAGRCTCVGDAAGDGRRRARRPRDGGGGGDGCGAAGGGAAGADVEGVEPQLRGVAVRPSTSGRISASLCPQMTRETPCR
ncbi:MAG: hypothetical protein FJ037_03705 [Chloroflexi bacterium]|nr:hypothetical protein [Chloroflexota bacterium]